LTLEGGKETIRKNNPILFIEIIERLKIRNFVNKNYSKTILLLSKMGYETYIYRDGTLAKVVEEVNIDGVYMYLFLHKDKHRDLIEELVPYVKC
jgi:hypothetical protein